MILSIKTVFHLTKQTEGVQCLQVVQRKVLLFQKRRGHTDLKFAFD